MKDHFNWKETEFVVRFPGIGKSLSTTPEEKKLEVEQLAILEQEYFARGGTITQCPPCTCSSDETVVQINKARSKAVADANAARAA